jgi:CRP-like cAMP-binding protein
MQSEMKVLRAAPIPRVSNIKQPPTSNRLLAALPADEYDRLLPSCELVRLPKNRILYEAGDEVHYAYFLNSGMASLLAITEEGFTIDLGAVGREGFIGDPIIQDVGTTPYRAVVQAPSEALRIKADVLRAELNRVGKLRKLLQRHASVLQTQMVQALICNLFHPVESRFSRWLLVASDCLDTTSFEMTQEDIALMLGKHRNRISVAAGKAQETGLIEYDRRGRITILDRQGLEASACECYRIVKECVKNSFDRPNR